MDLYYKPGSPTCCSSLMVASALGLKLNKIEKDSLAGETLQPEFVKLNPQHTVPTLVDDGFVIWESRAIIIYLAEKYDKTRKLYPTCIKKRAVINPRLFFDMALFQSFGDYFYQPLIHKKPVDPELFKKFDTNMTFLNTFLEGQTYVTGEDFNLADIALFCTTANISGIGFDLSKYSNVTRWLENVKKVSPGWDEMSEGILKLKEIIKKFKDSPKT